MLLKSITTVPGRTPSATPTGPNSTASTSGVSGRQSAMHAAPRAASAALAAQAAPAASSDAALSRLRLWIVSAKPARARFAAIAAPITPRPMKATRAGGRITAEAVIARQARRSAARISSSSVSMSRWKPGPSA